MRDRYPVCVLTIVKIIAGQIAFAFRSRVALQAENAACHQQVDILRRHARQRARVTRTDRVIFELFLRLCRNRRV
jgi:hypothetical protein